MNLLFDDLITANRSGFTPYLAGRSGQSVGPLVLCDRETLEQGNRPFAGLTG